MAGKSTPNTNTEVKETKENFKDKAAKIFKDYPKCGELFFTADGTAFFQKNDADNYATSLKDKKVVSFKK